MAVPAKLFMDLDSLPPTRDWDKKNLIGLSVSDLEGVVGTIPGAKSYTASQIWRFIYNRGVSTIDEMHNIPKDVKDTLKEKYTIDYGRILVCRIGQGSQLGSSVVDPA